MSRRSSRYVATAILACAIAIEAWARVEEEEPDPAAGFRAMVDFVTRLGDPDKGLLPEQAGYAGRIKVAITEVAFPFPPGDPRGKGVTRDIDIPMGQIWSYGTEIDELRPEWEFSRRTAPFAPQHRNVPDTQVQRADLEELFGVPQGATAWRENVHVLAATATENLLSSHVPAAGQWLTILPGLEAESAAGERTTPGQALRDGAFFTAGAGRIAHNNTDLMTQRLTLDTLEWGETLFENRMADQAGLSVYETLGGSPRRGGGER